MLDMHTALERVLETVEPMPVEVIPVTEVKGRVVAEDLHVTRPFRIQHAVPWMDMPWVRVRPEHIPLSAT